MSQQAAADSTVVLITGANQGIGLALAKAYTKKPKHIVIGTSRDVRNAEELSKTGAKVVQLDVDSDENVAGLPRRLADIGIDRIHVLNNNAGVGKFAHGLGSSGLIQEALEQYNTNVLGILRVVNLLIPLLRKAASSSRQAKIVNISSMVGTVTSNTSNPYFKLYGYNASKAAVNIITVSLARDLEQDNILAVNVHPGVVSTRMLDFNGEISPEVSAEGIQKVVDRVSKLDDAFKLWNYDGTVIPW